MIPESKANRERIRGTALVEFAIGLVLFFSVVLGSCDFFMLIFYMQLNDSVCQDAARVASIGDPSSAQARAAAIVARANEQSKSRYRLINVVSTATPGSSQQGSAVIGDVTVETSTIFTPQALRWVLPAIVLRAKQTFPFTYISRPPRTGP